MNNTKESETGQSQTCVFVSESMGIICGFQEMPDWSIDPAKVELIKSDLLNATAWRIMSCSRKDGSNPLYSTVYTNSCLEATSG